MGEEVEILFKLNHEKIGSTVLNRYFRFYLDNKDNINK
jgi:hypothetical protein